VRYASSFHAFQVYDRTPSLVRFRFPFRSYSKLSSRLSGSVRVATRSFLTARGAPPPLARASRRASLALKAVSS
jgi:hypothetical protein